MNKKMTVMLVAAIAAGVAFARPGPGFHGGFRGGPPPMRVHGGPRFHHHHHHHHGYGWGVAGAVLGTAAVVHDIVRPAPIVVAPAPTVVAAPVTTVYAGAPVMTYAPPPPPVYYRTW